VKYREIASSLVRQGGNVALYCSGLFADTNIRFLEKFCGVKPVCVIDNDAKKKGFAELGVPIMPFKEASEKFDNLYFYIQGNTYIYSVTGDLLNNGVSPDKIINYVPVEERDGCLIAETSIGVSNANCNVCYETGFNYNKNNNTLGFDELNVEDFEKRFAEFRKNAFVNPGTQADCRKNCPLFKRGVYAQTPKIRLVGDYNSDYCELSCVYCFLQELGMSSKRRQKNFHEWLDVLLQSNVVGDSLVLHLCPTEKTKDEDIDRTLELCGENMSAFETVHLFSCCYAYREGLEPLLQKGAAKSFWSFDAGTEETFEKIKRRKRIFQKVLDNVERYKRADVFDGFSIVPKYSIVKGMNDNEKDFDGFVRICKNLNVGYCALQYDYAKDDEFDQEVAEKISMLYRKVMDAGLKITYTSGSTFLSKALNSLAFYEAGK
jgi:hypothetical protein